MSKNNTRIILFTAIKLAKYFHGERLTFYYNLAIQKKPSIQVPYSIPKGSQKTLSNKTTTYPK